MLDKINSIEERYEEINRQIAENVDDYQVTVELMKERAEIEDVVEKGRQYKEILRRIAEARELQHDPEMAGLAEIELSELEPAVGPLEAEIRSLLLPKDPRDSRNVIVEIRAGK